MKLGIKEKVEEERGMEKNVQIGNEWWTIMTIYSKEMKTTIIIGVEDAMKKKKQGRMYALRRGLQRENRRKRSKKLGRSERGW
jgi:hypothetical protein